MKGIIFSKRMYRAIGLKEKTITRRIIKPQPVDLPVTARPPYQKGEIVYVKTSRYTPQREADLFLEIVSVNPEPLQNIRRRGSDYAVWKEIVDEGIESYDPKTNKTRPLPKLIFCFLKLWESLHGPGSWNDNPWVWRIRFKRFKGQGA